MIILHLFCSLALVQQTTSFFGSKILRIMATDEPAPSRFLMMDYPMIQLYQTDIKESTPSQQMSLSDVSSVIDSVLQTKDAKISSETKDTSNLDYEIAVNGNRKLNLLVNMQDTSVQLKLSSSKEKFDKEVKVATDSAESKKEIRSFLIGSFDDFKSQTEGRSLAQLTITDNQSLAAYLMQSQQLNTKFEFVVQSKDSVSSRISVRNKSTDESEDFAEIAIVNQVSSSEGEPIPSELSPEKFVKIWFNLKENERIDHHYRHALFAHSIGPSDNDSSLEKFITDKLAEIKRLLDEKAPKKDSASFETAVQRFMQLVESLKNPKSKGKAFDKIEDDHIRDIVKNDLLKSNSHIIRATFTGSPSYDIQIVLFKAEESDVMGIHMAALDREYEAKVPLADFETRFQTLTPIISEFLVPDLSSISFNSLQSAVEKVNSIIKNLCGKKPFLGIELMKLEYGQTLQVYSNPKVDQLAIADDIYKTHCLFNYVQVRIVQYSFGFFHFIHLNIDNEYLHSEYLLSPHSETFSENVSEIFDELFAELNQLKEDHKNNLVGKELTFSQITHIFDKIMKKKEPSESKDVVEFVNDDNTMEVKVKKLATGFCRISFIRNPWSKGLDGIDNSNTIKEIYIPENNGLNQLERMRGHILKFLKVDIPEHIKKIEPIETKAEPQKSEVSESIQNKKAETVANSEISPKAYKQKTQQIVEKTPHDAEKAKEEDTKPYISQSKLEEVSSPKKENPEDFNASENNEVPHEENKGFDAKNSSPEPEAKEEQSNEKEKTTGENEEIIEENPDKLENSEGIQQTKKNENKNEKQDQQNRESKNKSENGEENASTTEEQEKPQNDEVLREDKTLPENDSNIKESTKSSQENSDNTNEDPNLNLENPRKENNDDENLNNDSTIDDKFSQVNRLSVPNNDDKGNEEIIHKKQEPDENNNDQEKQSNAEIKKMTENSNKEKNSKKPEEKEEKKNLEEMTAEKTEEKPIENTEEKIKDMTEENQEKPEENTKEKKEDMTEETTAEKQEKKPEENTPKQNAKINKNNEGVVKLQQTESDSTGPNSNLVNEKSSSDLSNKNKMLPDALQTNENLVGQVVNGIKSFNKDQTRIEENNKKIDTSEGNGNINQENKSPQNSQVSANEQQVRAGNPPTIKNPDSQNIPATFEKKTKISRNLLINRNRILAESGDGSSRLLIKKERLFIWAINNYE